MTWRWRPTGLPRAVWHAFHAWRALPTQEARWDAACGLRGGEDVEVDADGREWCLACRRALARQPGPA